MLPRLDSERGVGEEGWDGQAGEGGGEGENGGSPVLVQTSSANTE